MSEDELPENLVYVSDATPGITRRKRGRGFAYYTPEGRHIKNPKTLKRIKSLVIPPAWQEVWICRDEYGHIQATGRDARHRKQYRYHPDWEAFSNRHKYDHLLEFADLLPALRSKYRRDLKSAEWDRRKVLALAVALMDELSLRIGNPYYSKQNDSYGLTTLRRKHVDFGGGKAHLSFTGKKGVQRDLELEDKKLTKLLRECSELPGYELFRYHDGERQRTIDSSDFNEYINSVGKGGSYVTSKDFRTWNGTVTCVEYEAEAAAIVEANPRKKKETTLVQLVADYLGNTVSTCRKYYIHPKVLAYCVEHTNIEPTSKANGKYKEYTRDERIVLDILNA